MDKVIRQAEIDYDDFLNNYNLHEEYSEWLKDNDIEDDEENKKIFSKEEKAHELKRFNRDQIESNYPIWNTLFEFREKPSEEMIKDAINSGFGVIESEYFNTILFVAGCGYSFYGKHWIPLYLKMPWVDKTKYDGIYYGDL